MLTRMPSGFGSYEQATAALLHLKQFFDEEHAKLLKDPNICKAVALQGAIENAKILFLEHYPMQPWPASQLQQQQLQLGDGPAGAVLTWQDRRTIAVQLLQHLDNTHSVALQFCYAAALVTHAQCSTAFSAASLHAQM